jgi:hypothetical protein
MLLAAAMLHAFAVACNVDFSALWCMADQPRPAERLSLPR